MIFRDNNGCKQAHQSQNEANFATFYLGLERFLNEAEKETEKETWHQRRHDSLHCPRVKLVKF